MATPPSAGQRRLSALAMSCLEEREEVAEAWFAETLAAGYADGVVATDDLRQTAHEVFDLLLRSIAGHEVSTEMGAVAARIGGRRAEQGVPLDALVAAVRKDAQVVWNALTSRATPDDYSALLTNAPLVWEVVERLTLRIVEAYQQSVLEQRRKIEDERRRAFDRLIQTGGRHPATVQETAQALAMDAQGRFCVVMSDLSSATELRRAVERLQRRGVPCHTHGMPSGQVLLVQIPDLSALDLNGLLRNVRCGVAPMVEGLAEVADALRFATATLRAIPAGGRGPRYLTEAWLGILVAQAPDVSRRLVESVLDPVRSLPGTESERLIEAVKAYCYGDGSVGNTAAALYCHRNTLLNRLARFRDLTGRDIRSPADAAVVMLALEACEQLAGEAASGISRVS